MSDVLRVATIHSFADEGPVSACAWHLTEEQWVGMLELLGPPMFDSLMSGADFAKVCATEVPSFVLINNDSA